MVTGKQCLFHKAQLGSSVLGTNDGEMDSAVENISLKKKTGGHVG